MKFDLTANVHVREGRGGCEFAKDFAGSIKDCLYHGLCDSKVLFGYSCFCAYGLIKPERSPAGAGLDKIVRD